MIVDGSGNLFLSDTFHQRIRKVTPGGIITTFLGDGSPTATFGHPGSLAVGGGANLYVVTGYNQGGTAVQRVAPTGVITKVAGTGTTGDTGRRRGGDGSPPSR